MKTMNRSFNKLGLFAIAFATLFSVSFAEARIIRRPLPPREVTHVGLLGSTQLNYLGDADRINVRSCGDDNEYVKQVKVRVVEGSAEIYSIRINFANGRSDSLNIRSNFERGTESRWVDLPGTDRCVRTIQVIGRSRLSGHKATVQVWGLISHRRH